MSAADAPTLTQVLSLAQRLAPADKLRLIAHLAPELATALPAEPTDNSWDELMRLGDEATLLPPLAEDSADVLSSMRR